MKFSILSARRTESTFPINLLANFAENFSKRKLEASEMKQNGERAKFVIFFKGMNRPFQLGILAPISSLLHGYGFFYECFFSIGCFNASVLTLTWASAFAHYRFKGNKTQLGRETYQRGCCPETFGGWVGCYTHPSLLTTNRFVQNCINFSAQNRT